MAIEAPVSKYKKNNLRIFIILCIVAAVWFGYDGYFSKKFIEKHQDVQGNPDSTLAFNRKSPPYFIGAAAVSDDNVAVPGKNVDNLALAFITPL